MRQQAVPLARDSVGGDLDEEPCGVCGTKEMRVMGWFYTQNCSVNPPNLFSLPGVLLTALSQNCCKYQGKKSGCARSSQYLFVKVPVHY